MPTCLLNQWFRLSLEQLKVFKGFIACLTALSLPLIADPAFAQVNSPITGFPVGKRDSRQYGLAQRASCVPEATIHWILAFAL